jgi:predicted DNA-binding transcriptional regulator AlpA
MQFLTNISEQEFKQFLKEALRDVLSEQLDSLKEKSSTILDVRQAADFLKMKVATLYEKTSRKLIPHFKRGNKLYFQLSEIQQWVRSGKVKTQGEIECEATTFTLNTRPHKSSRNNLIK